MQDRTPTRPLVPDFTPVPRRYRCDGWTAARQRAFITALADTGSVRAAAKRINMSSEGAYYLRRQPGAEEFAAAWNTALDHGVQTLADIAIGRARDGVPIPIFHKGEQVGEKRWYNDRLLMFILRHHMPSRYGADLPRGTRHSDTIAREAAENCPVCKERAEAEAKEAAETLDFLAKIFKRYEAKVRSERHFRLSGRIVAADFTVRQLTHIELILACGGKTQEMIDLWAREPPVSIGRGGIEHEAHPISEELDRIRQKVWQAAGDPPRPRLPLDRRQCIDSSMCGGPTHMERDKARLAAEARMAEAQREWEATAEEGTWLEWKARGRRISEG